MINPILCGVVIGMYAFVFNIICDQFARMKWPRDIINAVISSLLAVYSLLKSGIIIID